MKAHRATFIVELDLPDETAFDDLEALHLPIMAGIGSALPHKVVSVETAFPPRTLTLPDPDPVQEENPDA